MSAGGAFESWEKTNQYLLEHNQLEDMCCRIIWSDKFSLYDKPSFLSWRNQSSW